MFGRKLIVILTIATLIGLGGCGEAWLDEPYSRNAYGVFDAVWDEFDKTYGAFEAKGINWDSCRTVYRRRLTEYASWDDVHAVLCSLMRELNDGHVQLLASGYKRFYSVAPPTIFPDSRYYENASEIGLLLDLVKTRYLYQLHDSGGFFYGYIALHTVAKNVGYLYIPSFDRDNFSFSFIDEAMRSFDNCSGIIVDLRFNGGGSSEVLLRFANRFTDVRRKYLLSKMRNGPRHTDFSPFVLHVVTPEGVHEGQKPLIILVNKHTASSAEHFVLAMRARPHTLVVGDTTFGALSTVVQRMAPNGWEYRTCPQLLYDTTGNILRNADGRYPDGIGLPPDLYVRNYLREVYRGYDRVLSYALVYFENYFAENNVKK